MSEHEENQVGRKAAEPSAAAASIPEMTAPPLSPGEIPPVEAVDKRDTSVEPAEAEVIMLPAKFASFLASTATRFHERSRAMPSGARRTAAVAMVAIVACGSAFSGAMFASKGATVTAERSEQAEQARVVRESVARIESELAALRSNMDRTAKLSAAHAGKTGERLDRIEKAQAEPAARLAKLTESVEKLRATPPAAAPVVTATAAPSPAAGGAQLPVPAVTGSIAAQAGGAPAKAEPAVKPAIVDGWILRDAERDAALIEGRNGLLEVYAGDVVPGVGRVEAVRRQDGKWVVVTPKGLIVTR